MNAVIRLRGYITPEGKLEIELPSQTEPGAVDVIIQPALDAQSAWTEEELTTLLTAQTPKSGAEIADWLLTTETGWEDGEDGASWVKKQRHYNG